MNTKGFNHNACIICNKSPYKNPGVSLHRFPTCEKLRRQWLRACNMTEDDYRTSRRVCSNHFDKKCFNTTNIRKSLKSGSVPTIFTEEELEHPTLEEKSENENIELLNTPEKSSNEKKNQYCPPTMVRYDNPSINLYKTKWVCRICLTVILSEDAVHKHLKTPCKHKIIPHFGPENVHNGDNDDDDDDDNNEDDDNENESEDDGDEDKSDDNDEDKSDDDEDKSDDDEVESDDDEVESDDDNDADYDYVEDDENEDDDDDDEDEDADPF